MIGWAAGKGVLFELINVRGRGYVDSYADKDMG